MSNGINKVMIVGNLGRDPEARTAASGTTVAQLNVAVSERRKEGEAWVDHTEWVRVVTFGKTADNAVQFLQKGRQVFVEGRLQTKSYKDKDGVEKWSTDVIAEKLVFLGGPQKDDAAPRAKPARGKPGDAIDMAY
jgi:single-strand DNA-binding protein